MGGISQGKTEEKANIWESREEGIGTYKKFEGKSEGNGIIEVRARERARWSPPALLITPTHSFCNILYC